MSNSRIEIIDEALKELYILHCRHRKYWQIKFEGPISLLTSTSFWSFSLESQQKVFIECGLLLENSQKDTKTIIGKEQKVSGLRKNPFQENIVLIHNQLKPKSIWKNVSIPN